MMETLREWLMAMIAVSVVCAGADSLMPTGGVRQVGRLVCGLAMLCVMVQPLSRLGGGGMERWMKEYADYVHVQQQNLEDQAQQRQKHVIEDSCASYIADRGAELGVICRAEVECVYHPDGVWLPERVSLWGAFDDVTQSALTRMLEREFAIPAERQSYYLTKEGSA